MEVSTEKLKELESLEYEELKNLKRKKQQYSKVFGLIVLILFYASNILLFLASRHLSNEVFRTAFAFYFAFTLLMLPGAISLLVSGELDDSYSKIFNYFFKLTKTNSKIENYESYFTPIEKEIEKEALSILENVEEKARQRLSDNQKINNYLWRKRNRNLYLYEIEKARKNYELNQETLKIVDKNIKYIKFDLEKRKYFEKLQRNLRHEYIKWLDKLNNPIQPAFQNTSSSEKKVYFASKEKTIQPDQNHQSLKTKEKFDSKVNPLGINDKTIKKETKNIFPKISRETPPSQRIIELPKSSIEESLETFNEPKQLELDFDDPKINLRDLDDIPKKKNTPKYERIIKVSNEYYSTIANKTLDIGRKGEILVMDYERQRLAQMSGDIVKRLQHSSVEIGDGLGYDIRSFDDGTEVYIEVKTTTGSFWSNLFFTQNEFDKMKKYKEQYYLYRICNFDVDTNLGELFIFKGQYMIESYFEFQSKVYVLTQK